jgi:hypothetical protein
VTAARPAAAARRLLSATFYIVPALLLAWFAGGQVAFGRIDAALAIPLLMPGALWLAWRVRGEALPIRLRVIGAALLGLLVAQLLLQLWLGKAIGAAQLGLTFAAGVLACGVAVLVLRKIHGWRGLFRWLAMLLLVPLWFAAGQWLVGIAYTPIDEQPAPRLAVLTGLPLRWAGDDLTAMLAAGPTDAPVVGELAQHFDVHLIDSLSEVGGNEPLLVAHPRALAPDELVRLDALTRDARTIVILADALSSWEPPYALGDPRNPPVTSLLTPLLDHWGIALAAPDRGVSGWEGDVDVFLDPGGRKLRLHSAGRFTRLPPGCATYGDRRVARCPVGKATVWLVGDADLLHESLWQSPIAGAPWFRRSDNLAWLAGALKPAGRPLLDPIWIRP